MKGGCPHAIIGGDPKRTDFLIPALFEQFFQIRLFPAVILKSRVTVILLVHSLSHDGLKQLPVEQNLCSGSILHTLEQPEGPVRSFITSKLFFR
jgi:hypothetical protein